MHTQTRNCNRVKTLFRCHLQLVSLRYQSRVISAATMASGNKENRQLLSVAPMMDWTDLHYRQLARIISKKTWLWTEMVVDKTILHTQTIDKFLWFPPEQKPIVCQMGGSDPETLAAATKKVIEYGYDEINLNCGCPSDRVAGAGCFGASLMKQPELVAACMKAMGDASGGVPVTVKCRLGVDDADSYDQLHTFVKIVSQGSPVTHFVVHARKCFLHGLNPQQNRSVPPLRYEWVYSLRRDFPHLQFSLNGGIQNCWEAKTAILYDGPWPTPGHVEMRAQQQQQQQQHSDEAVAEAAPSVSYGADCMTGAATQADRPIITGGEDTCLAVEGATYVPIQGGMLEGVMIGRAAYNDPWGCLADADRAIFGEASNPCSSRREVLEKYTEYADAIIGKFGTRPDGVTDPNVRHLIKPILGLFHGEAGSKRWKNALDTCLKQDPPSVGYILAKTLHHIPDSVLDAPPRKNDALPPRSFGDLAKPEDKAGFSQTLTALKRAAREAGTQPSSKRALDRQQQTQVLTVYKVVTSIGTGQEDHATEPIKLDTKASALC